MRDGFIMHEKTIRQMARLPREDAGFLVECMAAYYRDGKIDMDKIAEESLAVAVILDDAIERMDADAEAYERSVDQRRKAAEKRWNNANDMRDDAECMREDATALRENADGMRTPCEDDAKNAVSVSVSDSVSVLEKENSPTESKRKRFVPPSVDEVRAYCLERHNNVDAESFVAFYESKGWKVGNTPMKNWKSAIVTWEKRQKQKAPPGNKFQNFPINEDNRRLVARVIAANR